MTAPHMILKLQKPLFTNEAVPMVLAYDHARTFEKLLPYTDQWKEFFEEWGLEEHMKAKVFVVAHQEPDGLFVDEPITKDLGW
jgi:hypothetical protein